MLATITIYILFLFVTSEYLLVTNVDNINFVKSNRIIILTTLDIMYSRASIMVWILVLGVTP
jgi:hypothetical protein